MKLIPCLLAISAFLAAPVYGQDGARSEPLTIGTSFIVTADGTERRINVVPPIGYAGSQQTYPLMLMLDAGLKQDFFLALGMERWNQLWQRSAQVIFVGIETIDRQRELLPPTVSQEELKRYPTAGESEAFRTLLSSRILPMLRQEYRNDGRAFLIGESAAGHFVAETWMNHPHMFDGYAALSPSLQWNGQQLSRQVAATNNADHAPLFISLANEGGETEEGIMRFVSGISSEKCFSDRRADLVHANTLHGLLPEVLQYLLPTQADWLSDYGLTLRCETKMGESLTD